MLLTKMKTKKGSLVRVTFDGNPAWTTREGIEIERIPAAVLPFLYRVIHVHEVAWVDQTYIDVQRVPDFGSPRTLSFIASWILIKE